MKVCNGYPLLISRFLDGDLSPVEERELREHLASCEACRLYYQQLSAIGEQLHEDIPYPADLHRSIMGAVAAERKKVVRFRPRRLIGAVAAAVAVCVVAGVTARGGLFRMGSAKSESAAPETVMMSMAISSQEEALEAKDAPMETMMAESVEADEVEQKSVRIEEPAAVYVTTTAMGAAPSGVTVYDNARRDTGTEATSVISIENGGLPQLAKSLGPAARGYAWCMVASGWLEDMPENGELDGGEDLQPGALLLIPLDNDPFLREQLSTSLSESGFTVSLDATGTCFSLDRQADEGLLIIELKN